MKWLLIIVLLSPLGDDTVIKSYDVIDRYWDETSCRAAQAIENTDTRENRLAICIEDTPPQN